ncbi:ABC transporter substrate-binding protein [Frigoribacterium faeni]|jgi:multiple sugar transport system substrate-binding protein|uniref:ABC transporter substrate-binding protein n=1 Tax=Frigoribacterium faeni TaxID=145483 RepID=UPI00141B0D55|nr:ABC transporter substrate-binding protein [Frigoribacterium faeni]NIJ04655.1 multiple sugar transport system substrate-binding protein [Frigoribacterium faeni]
MNRSLVTRMVAVAATVGLGASLAGCSAGGASDSSGSVSGADYTGPKVTIDFWNGWTGGAAPKIVPELVEQFNSEHDNIVVKSVPMEWADIAAKMPLAIKAGKGPDVAVAHGDDVATYAAQGLLLDSGDIVDGLGYTADDFPEGLFEGNQYQGTQYGIPWSVTPLGLYVNNDVLKAAGVDTTIPTDAESYEASLAALKAAGVQGEWVDGYVFTGTFEFQSLLWQFGGDLYDDDVTKATFNSEAGVKALTHMVDQIEKGYSPENVPQDGNFNALVKGENAYNWNGVWQTTNEALQDVDFSVAPVPQIGTEKAVWSSSTDWIFPSNKGQSADETSAAATFVKWMNDNSAGWAETGELPAANEVRDDPALVEEYPNLAPFLEQLPYAHYETVSPGISAASAEITTAVGEAVLGKKSPQDALDDAATKVDKILEQNAQTYGG